MQQTRVRTLASVIGNLEGTNAGVSSGVAGHSSAGESLLDLCGRLAVPRGVTSASTARGVVSI